MSKKKILSINEILDNPVRELDVPGIGKVIIRDPTVEDRIEANKEASKHPNWKDMNEVDQRIEVQKYVSLRMLVEPNISIEDYKKANDLTILTILDTIAMDYGRKLKKLTDKRKGVIDSFLQEMKKES